ncbi:MAG: Hsp20/alpha crystallin family protein [Opitutales bacterium]
MSHTALEKTQAGSPVPKQRNWRRPVYEVSENTDAFKVRVLMPGVKRDGVEISIEDETLSIVGTRLATMPEGWRPLRRELPEGDYRLNLRLNVPVNEGKIKARVEDGLLDLTLPKADEVKPRKIKVS